MNRAHEKAATQSMKNWVRDDSFVCAIHIASGDYSQKQLVKLLANYVKAKLNKYLVGRRWQKLHNSEHLQIFWFKEGQDINGEGLGGYYKDVSSIDTTLKLNSDKQAHYHCLVRCDVALKNTKIMGIESKNNESLLVEMTLRQIFREYQTLRVKKELGKRKKELAELNNDALELEIEKIKKTKYLDIMIRNCHEYDFYQQTYVAKNFYANESSIFGSDNMGIV